MTDQPSDLDIVDMPEIARRAHVRRPTVSMWRERHKDFPTSWKRMTIGEIWLWPDVEAWLVKTGRLGS